MLILLKTSALTLPRTELDLEPPAPDGGLLTSEPLPRELKKFYIEKIIKVSLLLLFVEKTDNHVRTYFLTPFTHMSKYLKICFVG